MSKLTRQGVRDLSHLVAKSKGVKPSKDAEYLAGGRLPPCPQHRIQLEEEFDEFGLVGYVKRCAICGRVGT
jgi:hypothetical protein